MTNQILCVPQRGIGDLVHTLPLIHSLRAAFRESKIVIPVVDKRQENDSQEMENLFEGILSFSYRQINEDLEKRRLELYKSKDFPERYSLEADKRLVFEKEMYDYYLDGEEYSLAVVLRKFRIENLNCPVQLTLHNLDRVEREHIVDRNLRFMDVLKKPKLLDFSFGIKRNERSAAVPKFPKDYVVFFLERWKTN